MDLQSQIVELSADWQRTALELVLGNLSPKKRTHCVNRLTQSGKPIRGLMGALQGDKLLGAAWAQMLPGRTATIWPPCIVRADDALGQRLAAATVEAAFVAGAKIAQAVLFSVDLAEARWLEAAGMSQVADMESLVWQVPPGAAEPLQETQRDDLQWDNYAGPADWQRLEALLTQTWIGSLDCPALEGSRDPSDVLEGFLAAGTSEARLWSILRYRGEDAGCVLLADHSENDEIELVYMGLVPHQRGLRHGHALAQKAQQMARVAGRCYLTTAVDAANAPARAVYAAAGFACYDRRRVFFRPRA